MKYLSLIFAALLSMSLVIVISCNDDDDEPGPAGPANTALEETIWVLESRVAADCTDPNDNENANCDSECNVIRINKDGTITVGDNDGIYTVPYTKSGNILSVEIVENQTMDVTYVITGANMTITYVDNGCNVTEVYKATTESLELVGITWEKRSATREDCNDPNNECDDCDFPPLTWTLSADGNATRSFNGIDYPYTYILNGNIMTLSWIHNGDSTGVEAEYEIISDIMTVRYNGHWDSAGDLIDNCASTETYRAK